MNGNITVSKLVVGIELKILLTSTIQNIANLILGAEIDISPRSIHEIPDGANHCWRIHSICSGPIPTVDKIEYVQIGKGVVYLRRVHLVGRGSVTPPLALENIQRVYGGLAVLIEEIQRISPSLKQKFELMTALHL